MGWPQLVWIGLACLGAGVSLALHGKPRDPHNFWTAMLGTAISAGLLYAGGFFS